MAAALLVAAAMTPEFSSPRAEDNRLAYRLHQQQKYTEAAELFSEPAWKGVAFYRSQQWWRALEAFSRAGDAESLYNLGNTYVQLGYLALALQAYQSTLLLVPAHADAKHNMALVKAALDSDDDLRSQQGIQPKKKAIAETIEKNDDEGGQQSPDSTHHDRDDEESAPGERDSTETTESQPKETRSARARNERQQTEQGDDSNPAGGDIRGQSNESAQQQDAGGAAENVNPAEPGSADSSQRLDEREQATIQWLNRIDDDPARFLQRRIALEQARRKARGTALEPATDPW